MSIILVDCDGVLSDFVTPALEIIQKLGGPRLKHDEVVGWDMGELLSDEPGEEGGASPRASFMAAIGQYGWCSALKPYPDAAGVIEELRRIGNVVCVTSPFDSETWAYERLRWLKAHFGFDKKHVVSTNNKVWVPGQALADDGVHNLEAWGREGSYLVARSYNAADNAGHIRGPFSAFVEFAERRVREYQLRASLD